MVIFSFKNIIRLLPTTLVVSTPLALAQTLPTITAVRYEGLIQLSPLIANEIARIQTNAPLDLVRVNESIVDFYKQGYFKDIWVTEENGVLTYHFVEKPIVASLEISGYGTGKDQSVIDKEVGLKKGDMYDEQKLQQARRNIMDMFEQQGYYDTVVEAKTEDISLGAVKVTLEVNRGEEIIINKANYLGRKNLKLSRIENFTANKEREWLGWMWGFNDGKLRISELENDSLRIKDLYMQRGFLDVEVSKPYLETDFTNYTAEITYQIKEGSAYKITGIDVVLEDEVVDPQTLREKLSLKVGDIFNVDKMRKDMDKMRFEIGDLGYAFARITPDLDKDAANSEVRIVYYIQPGHKVNVNNVIISGNTRTLDRVVRRNVLLAPGDLYNMTKLLRSRNAIQRTGAFEDVKIDERRVSEDKIDLIVQVKEARTGEFTFGLGYGSYEGVMGSASIKDRNIFGSGLTTGLYFDKSEKSTSYRLNLYNPAVLDSDYSLSGDLFRSDYDTYDYTQVGQGITVMGGRRFTESLEATLGATYQTSEMSNFRNPAYARYYSGAFTKQSVVPGIFYDDTDDYFFPRDGIRVQGSTEYAGFAGDSNFLKFYGTFAYYKNLQDLTDIDLIFRYKAQAGYVKELDYLPISEKFYLGGVSNLRGFKSSSVTPFDEFGARIGGKEMLLNSVEVSYGLFETVQMRLTGFFDYGMIGQSRLNEIQRYSTGFAIEWLSPIGSISFVIPFALNAKNGDDVSHFEFTMGQRF